MNRELKAERRIVLIETASGTAAENMALDEALFGAVEQGAHKPFLRFYTWSPPAVTIGYPLDAAAEVDLAGCAAAGSCAGVADCVPAAAGASVR